LPEISQKVAQKLLQKKPKVAFCDESRSKVAKKAKLFVSLFFYLV